MQQMQHAQHIDATVREIAAFADTVRGVDLSTPVPSCPDWDLAALVKHTGRVNRWSAAMVEQRVAERLDPRTLDLALPESADGLPDWLAAGAAILRRALEDADPDEPMWAWGADQHVRFWSRRQHHETSVHRADAELTLGIEPQRDAFAAADVIDELLDNLPTATYFAPAVANLCGDGESLHLHATDEGIGEAGEWMIVLEPEGFTWHHGHGKGSVAVRGRAVDLMLLMNRRREPDDGGRFEIFGDRAVLDRWLANSAL